MYNPEHFKENDREILFELIRNYPLGALVCYPNGDFEINHLPFEIVQRDQKSYLQAHIAKANPLFSLLGSTQSLDVVIIFQAENAYISPNWYLEKHIHHRAVPTWNYQVVHVKGQLQLINDEKSLRGILARLTRQHEATQQKPWRMSDAPEDYLEEMLTKIAAIEIEISLIEGKSKLSQNRNRVDVENVIQNLDENGNFKIANEMRKRVK